MFSFVDLRHMYRLLSPQHIHGLHVLTGLVEEHIKQTALSHVQSLKGENVSVQYRVAFTTAFTFKRSSIKKTWSYIFSVFFLFIV